MHSNLCTLFEGDYHLGVAALVNSLVRNGFEGDIWAGYRGSLPPWIASLKRIDESSYRVADTVVIHFRELSTNLHLTNYKPQFMLSLFEKTAAEALWYFDPDITIRCRWSFFTEWVCYGVSLCQEAINGTMPESHPLRMMWIDFARKLQLHSPRHLNQYFNGGFIGLEARQGAFLTLWSRLLDAAKQEGTDLSGMMLTDRSHPFYASDQDLLNMTAMYTDCPLSVIGPEGMGFERGGFTMYHAVAAPKPWRKQMIGSVLRGRPLSDADKHFVAHLDGPILPYSHFDRKLKKITCGVGSVVGRFYHRV